MKELDLSSFLEENETPNTRAYSHALDLAYLFVDEMERQGLSKKKLAEKMGISQSRLSNLLNTQPNMTLETIAQFELALGVNMSFSLEKEAGMRFEISTVIRDFDFDDLSAERQPAQVLEFNINKQKEEKQIKRARKFEVAA